MDGRITSIVDPVQDSVNYEYYKNGRLHKIINHRPSVQNVPNDPNAMTKNYPNLETEFCYSALGSLTSLKNPRELELITDYDEAGRKIRWYHQVPDPNVCAP